MSKSKYSNDLDVEEPTIDWLIDQIAPNKGNSPLVNFNKKRLRDLIEQTRTNTIDAAIAALPEKLVNTKEESDSDYFYGSGYNHAIEETQSNILKLKKG